MGWEVRFEREFDKDFEALTEEVQVELVAHAEVLERRGPDLGRPVVDTLRDSAYANMKELRFNADGGVWRVAFAFDRESRGVLLVAGDKAGLWDKDEERFYKRLIAVADARFAAYLTRLQKAQDEAAAAASGRATGSGERAPAKRGWKR